MKPMLAASVDMNNPEEVKQLKFPCYLSPKLDGVRALVKGGQLLSRSLKPIPNDFIQAALDWSIWEGLDGELIVGNPIAKDAYRKTVSAVMSEDGKPDFTYYVFDKWNRGESFYKFHQLHIELPKLAYPECIIPVSNIYIKSLEELLELEEKYIDAGWEGVMLRSPDGKYKFGRSTLKQGFLIKIKRFMDSEAEIIGIEELQHNKNTAKKNALGRTERSYCKAGLEKGNTLGALVVRDIHSDVIFEIGTGFDAALKQEIWNNYNTYLGKIVKYKYFPLGSKDKPRFPVFAGFRDARDL